MTKYPKINDNDFNKKINKIYNKYKINGKNGTIESYCKPKEFKLQLPQVFVSEFINPKTNYDGILIYHKIGSGKTCASIQIAEKWKKFRKIIVVLPASLKGNYRNELRSLCGGNNYLKPNERNTLAKLEPSDEKYKEIINNSDKRIDKYYDIYSYNKFIELCQEDNIKLNNKLLIIDEIQNMISYTGTYYNELKYKIDNSRNLRLVLLSATPMFDKPNEIALTINLLKKKDFIPIESKFEKTFISNKINNNKVIQKIKNLSLFKDLIKGYISYYAGAPLYTYPKLKIKYVKCKMSRFQLNAYKTVLNNEYKKFSKLKKIMNVDNLPNNFYIGVRFVSNIVFPNRRTDEKGYNSFDSKEIIKNLEKYSIKFYKILNKIKKKGKSFIYSSFKEYAGIKSLVKVLEINGYKNYVYHGSGKKRFAIWSGDEDHYIKEEIREVYNRKDNLYGDKLKLILGSPSIKEGVSLKAVKSVHIIEPYWNLSRLDQVIGRASRYCSHIDFEDEEDREVDVYIYLSISDRLEESIDQYIKNLSDNKNKIIKDFEKAIKESSIDCSLNLTSTINNSEEEINCDN